MFDIFAYLCVYVKDHSRKMCQNIDLHEAMISLDIFNIRSVIY